MGTVLTLPCTHCRTRNIHSTLIPERNAVRFLCVQCGFVVWRAMHADQPIGSPAWSH